MEHWEKVEGSVWKAIVSNEIFGDYNPFMLPLEGDWLLYPGNYTLHLGDVYMNGQSFYEAQSLEEVKNPKERRTGYNPPWTNHEEPIRYPVSRNQRKAILFLSERNRRELYYGQRI